KGCLGTPKGELHNADPGEPHCCDFCHSHHGFVLDSSLLRSYQNLRKCKFCPGSGRCGLPGQPRQFHLAVALIRHRLQIFHVQAWNQQRRALISNSRVVGWLEYAMREVVLITQPLSEPKVDTPALFELDPAMG